MVALSTLTKADLVEDVLSVGSLSRRDAEVLIESIFEAVTGAIRRGEKIEVRGFGSFRIRERGPRTGRNPKTGAKVEIPAKRVPYFKPSKELRDLLNPDGPADQEIDQEDAAITESMRPVKPPSAR